MIYSANCYNCKRNIETGSPPCSKHKETPTPKTEAERIEEAASESILKEEGGFFMGWGKLEKQFKAGVAWRDANPPPSRLDNFLDSLKHHALNDVRVAYAIAERVTKEWISNQKCIADLNLETDVAMKAMAYVRSMPHPDTVRLEWMMKHSPQISQDFHTKLYGVDSHMDETLAERIFKTPREAIDAAMEEESVK